MRKEIIEDNLQLLFARSADLAEDQDDEKEEDGESVTAKSSKSVSLRLWERRFETTVGTDILPIGRLKGGEGGKSQVYPG